MNAELWQSLDEAIEAFGVARRRHRDALDAYVWSAHAERALPSQACDRWQKLTEQARAEREIAAEVLALQAIALLAAHDAEQP
jgi:hypothetical protein